jgi:methyl-accepting chemotaxis protein
VALTARLFDFYPKSISTFASHWYSSHLSILQYIVQFCNSCSGANVIRAANASVRHQLRLAFAIVIAISFLSTGLAIWRLQALSRDTQALTEQPLMKERLISKWLLNMSVGAKRTAAVVRSSDPELASFFADEAKASTASSSELQKKVGELLATPEEKALFDQIGEVRKAYTSSRDRVTQLKAEGKNEEARALFDREFKPNTDVYIARTQDLLALQQKTIDAQARTVLASASRSQSVLMALSLATLVASIAAGMLFSRSLFRRLGGEPSRAVEVAAQIAAGNLRVQVDLAPGDDGSLMAAMQRMRDSLASMVAQVRESTHAIAESAEVISSEAQDLSSRTERQAAALEETASSMEELTQTVGHNTDNARHASELAAEASGVAREGGAMVGQLVDTMGQIDESSKRVSDIIGVIDGIAFQTNILALNAAVEAARAGEQGRGFAVVASEVRALAQRSAGAAKEIKDLIGDSTRRVEGGAKLAQQAGATMSDIVGGIERVSGIMSGIVESSREQSAGIAQVSQTVSQMDQTTQQNATLVEEAAAATTALREQAAALEAMMAVFQIGDPQSGATRRPAAQTAALPRPRTA